MWRRVVGSDPGRVALRRGGRLLVAGPAFLAVALGPLDNVAFGLFGAFAVIALLAFADFGGPPRPRTVAYLALTAAGAGLLAAGTLLSDTPIAAAGLMVVVGFAVRFLGYLGGYWSAAVSPAILAFVLGATVPTSGGAMGDRLAGWVVGGLLAAVVALVCWPSQPRVASRRAAARAARALAPVVAGLAAATDLDEGRRRELGRARDDLVRANRVPRRVASPATRDLALAFLVDELLRLCAVLEASPSGPALGAVPALRDDERALAALAAQALERAADALDRSTPCGAELVEAESRRLGTFAASVQAAVLGGVDPEQLVDELDHGFLLRLASYLAMSVLANTDLLLTGRVPPVAPDGRVPETPMPGGVAVVRRGIRTLVANLRPGSVWFQSSTRAGVALGLAVLVAGELSLEHGFWVVLGTLAVLRTNAFDTGRTAVEAAVGTAIGFALASIVFVFFGLGDPALWVLFVVSLFLAGYLPQAVGFVPGQAAFSVCIIALFNLIEPQGWELGLLRLENVAIGALVSLVVALVFWPRRALGVLRSAVAELFALAGIRLEEAVAALAAGGAPTSAATATAVAEAEGSASAAYEEALDEARGDARPLEPWAVRLALGAQVRGAADSIERVGGGRCGSALWAPAVEMLAAEARGLGVTLADASVAIAHGRQPRRLAVTADEMRTRTRPAMVADLRAGAQHGDASAVPALLHARMWIVELTALFRRAGERIDAASVSSR